jgi:hypothetical protein
MDGLGMKLRTRWTIYGAAFTGLIPSTACVPLGSSQSAALAAAANGEIGFTNESSLSLNGSTQYLETGTVPVSGYPFTVAAWIKTSNLNNQGIVGIYHSGSGNRWFHMRTRNAACRIAGESRNTSNRRAEGALSPCDGNWHFVVTVFAASNSRRTYIDGLTSGNNTQGANFYAPVNRFAIGAVRTSSPGQYFVGQIDEVSIWSSALGDAEIFSVYNSGVPTDISSDFNDYASSSSLRGWWRMGDEAGDNPLATVQDVQGNFPMNGVGLTSGSFVSDVP